MLTAETEAEAVNERCSLACSLHLCNTPQVYLLRDTILFHQLAMKNTPIPTPEILLIGQTDEGYSIIEGISCEACEVANQD